MKGRFLTAEMIAEFREHLILEERSEATVEKYIRDVTAFSAFANGGEISKETVIAYKKHLQGNYAVRCQIIEKDTTVLDLTLAAPGREAAQAMCHSWAKKSQDIYGMLMGELI